MTLPVRQIHLPLEEEGAFFAGPLGKEVLNNAEIIKVLTIEMKYGTIYLKACKK